MFIAVMLAALAADKDVHQLAERQKQGVLSTDFGGTPFGSLTPYALDAKGRPIIYISGLAAHTKNLEKNPKCSLTVFKEDRQNIFNSQRLTFVGKMVKVEAKEVADVFFKRHKQAKDFAKMHDFTFYRMEIEKLHYIGGFGDIRWLKPEDYLKPD